MEIYRVSCQGKKFRFLTTREIQLNIQILYFCILLKEIIRTYEKNQLMVYTPNEIIFIDKKEIIELGYN